MKEPFIAHVRKEDKDTVQPLRDHLLGVADLSKGFASKLGLGLPAELVGLLHDFGKYSQQFQNYLKSGTGLLNPDMDEYVDAKGLKGKIDHSTAGAQLVWRELSKQGGYHSYIGQILALCIASHHSGLIDCLTSEPGKPVADNFTGRMGKKDNKTHLGESEQVADTVILDRYESLINDPDLISGLVKMLKGVAENNPKNSECTQFQVGLLVRLVFSYLIDSDRIDSADFDNPRAAKHRLNSNYTSWVTLADRLEKYLNTLTIKTSIDHIRKDISDDCAKAANRSRGIYTLTVPTGGGKTLASLRYALQHAEKHEMSQIFYIIPFTSIIDQNADVVRGILEPANYPEEKGGVVLEHHSNLVSEKQTWRGKILSENWDAPVVFTTMVQFLETLFGSGTRGARRMHRLTNSVIIFDEIQTLPVRCVHIFNNAINFLAEQCGSSVVLCTATQPLLHDVDKEKGALNLSSDNEIVGDVQKLFSDLKRVDVKDVQRPKGWSVEEIAALSLEETKKSGSCLIVTNTKDAARKVYQELKGTKGTLLYHLSTNMCPIHRRKILRDVRESLDSNTPSICVSTQLIEAGVDVDFGSVIRYAAGLDSIAQAAGRCNRNKKRPIGNVYVINPPEEDQNLRGLEDIRIGLEKTQKVLKDFQKNPERYGDDLIGNLSMDWYYKNYFYGRKGIMDYPLKVDQVGRNDTLLNLLSVNRLASNDFCRVNKKSHTLSLPQSFMSAAKAFRAIDAPTQGIIVQYGEDGKRLVSDLCAASDLDREYTLLKKSQQYTVNCFPGVFEKLESSKAVREVQKDSGVYYLDEQYYSDEFGLCTKPVSEGGLLYVQQDSE